MSEPTVDKVIQAILVIREKRSTLKKAYDAEDGTLREKNQKLETWLLSQMQKSGATQLGSTVGTAYQKMQWKGSCSDWESYWNFIFETGRTDFVEKRISITALQEYYEETGTMPPGVNIAQEMRVLVRAK